MILYLCWQINAQKAGTRKDFVLPGLAGRFARGHPEGGDH